jgi:hypothetical protein
MPNLIIDKFYGGLSLGSKRGQEGSFRYGLGLNYVDDPDHITATRALVKQSSTTVADLPTFITSYNALGYAIGNAGKIYKNTAGTWSLLQTTANCKGQGLAVYGAYMYYRQNAQIGRMALASDTFTDNWQTSGATAVQTVVDYAPIKVFLNLCLFSNGRFLATWDDATFVYNRLTFPVGYHVRDIDVMGEYAVMAVNDNEDITQAKRGFLFFWDGTSTTYNFMTEVNEGGGISSIQANQNSVFVFAGGKGNIYEYNGINNKIKKIPYIGTSSTVFVYPGADTNFNGRCLFGLAGGTSTTAYKGIYSWGSPELGYPAGLNLENAISTGTIQGTGIDIGAVTAVGNDLYVGWKDGATYGIDKLSTTVNNLSVTCDSLLITTNNPCTTTRQKLFFKPLASGESITLWLKADQGSWVEAGSASYTVDGATTIKLLNYGLSYDDIEIRVVLAGTSTMPSLSKVIIEYGEDANL